MNTTKGLLFAATLCWIGQSVALAEDVYYHLNLNALKLTDGHLPAQQMWYGERQPLLPAMQPYAVLNGPGEVYVNSTTDFSWNPRSLDRGTISIKVPDNKEITGKLFVAQTNLDGMVQVLFKLTPAEATPDAKAAFFRAKQEHYQSLMQRNIPGGAWFRHEAQAAAGSAGTRTNSVPDGIAGARRWRESELENSFDLFTGGRALSENLQLDRVLPAAKAAEETVDLTNITGITVRQMDWKALIKDSKPELDPLAGFIPGDQHTVFFGSFQAMVRMIDEADANGTPVLQVLEPRSEDANSRMRYQKQLCLGLSEISRLLGPQVVSSVAFTGSDPFLRVGTDIAVLFESRNAALLQTYLAAQQKAAQSATPAAKQVKGDIEGTVYSGVVSPDRAVSSYIAAVSNVVFVSNSRLQLENLIRTANGKGVPPLSVQDEYVYFRTRYPRGDKQETALVVLTDAAIRRWCGPHWRIADSRRTRAAAVMSDLQAAHADALISGKAADEALQSSFAAPDAGELRFSPSGVWSSTYGTLHFMTPLAEIPLSKISRAEADAYQRWRDNYQNNWRQYFDPIAIRFSIAADTLGADLTVMPLIASTEYAEFIRIGSGARIAPDAGDPHTNALLHLVFAINTQSHSVQDAGNFVSNMAPGLKSNPFGWVGQSLALYADEDPFWDRLAQATNTDSFLEKNFVELPLVLYCEVKNPLGLAAFLTGLHAFVDQSAPKMTTWQNLEYNSKPYVKITAQAPTMEGSREFAVYYSPTPRALIVTLNESLLKRALDRQAGKAAAAGDTLKPANPWLGSSLCASAQGRFFEVLRRLTQDTYQTHMQLLAWNNLPVLNEWKRLYPSKDPVAIHEQLWGTKLLCPGGGAYVWNEPWGTMESTVFGHPGQPKAGSTKALAEILSADLGLTFENDGLSASGILKRQPKKSE